jgi:hypothetical protein
LTRAVARRLGNEIQGGFAKGMKYSAESNWGSPANKLVGTYEKELTRVWDELDRRPPRIVFDVGAAEGYYAVGSAVRWKNCFVHAWEAEDGSRSQLAVNAKLNGVEGRVRIHSACNEETLYESIRTLSPDLVIMDVEGAERDICSNRCVQGAIGSTWIIECHGKEVPDLLSARFRSSHNIEMVENQPRTADDLQIDLPWHCVWFKYDRWRLVDEGRPFSTPWLVAKPF